MAAKIVLLTHMNVAMTMNKQINVSERVEKAVGFFKQGYNCAQSVSLAYSDLYDIDDDVVKKFAAPFGGGMGRLREVCGAVTGMFLILGYEHDASDPDNKAAKTANYESVQRTAIKFKEEMGSYICADLLKIDRRPQQPNPDDRNSEYYNKRPCAYCVAKAAEILGNELSR